MRETQTTKICKGCGLEKTVDNFNRDKTTRDSFRGKCRECLTKQTMLWRENNKEKYLLYQEKYKPNDRERTRERRKAYKEYLESNKAWRLNNKVKRWAERKVWTEIEGGRLEKGPCEICGSSVFVDAHHRDYSKPLDIIWLCRSHHMKEHKDARDA